MKILLFIILLQLTGCSTVGEKMPSCGNGEAGMPCMSVDQINAEIEKKEDVEEALSEKDKVFLVFRTSNID